MKLTSRQVGEKLGITSSAVSGLMRKGLLHDITGRSGRHQLYFDSKEIVEFAKTYRKHSHSNGSVPKEARSTSNPHGIMSRLASIEAKLDKLVKMWE